MGIDMRFFKPLLHVHVGDHSRPIPFCHIPKSIYVCSQVCYWLLSSRFVLFVCALIAGNVKTMALYYTWIV